MDVATDDGFVAFYREYARTSVHAVSTAALTAFGTLTIVHRGFAAVALAAYLLPPLAIYARGSGTDTDDGSAAEGDAEAEPDPGESATASPDDDEPQTEPVVDWTSGRPPTDADLAGAAVTDDGAVAVGGGGTVLERTGGREPWTVALEDGPGADGASLHDAAVTADGGTVWAVGDGGTVGRRDAAGRWIDHSAPDGDTNNLVAVAATGAAGSETVLVADGGGAVRRGEYRDGEVAWDEPATPGSGSSIAALGLGAETGYVVDTAGAAFRTTDRGRSFTALDLDADGTPTAVAATDAGAAVATSEGTVHLYDGGRWTPERVIDGELAGLASDDRDGLVAVGGGAVHQRVEPGDWDRVVVPAPSPLRAVAVGPPGAVAVGETGALVEQWNDTTGD